MGPLNFNVNYSAFDLSDVVDDFDMCVFAFLIFSFYYLNPIVEVFFILIIIMYYIY